MRKQIGGRGWETDSMNAMGDMKERRKEGSSEGRKKERGRNENGYKEGEETWAGKKKEH